MVKTKKHKLRVIEQLRRKFPGYWTYEGYGRWQGPEFAVQCYAEFTPTWSDDCSTFTSIYRRTDTHELVLVGRTFSD